MVTLYRDEQVNTISYNLNIPKVLVHEVLTTYINMLSEKISNGEPARFLNICHIRVDGVKETKHETLAYTATELAKKLNQSSVVVGRILENYEESIIEDLKNGYSYNIRGLVNLKMEGGSVNSKKSTKYDGYDIRVMLIGSFKRRVKGDII